jgi:hypothetical protein
MNIFVLVLMAGAAGYAACVFTWPQFRQWLIGVENEIDRLRARARALETKLRG